MKRYLVERELIQNNIQVLQKKAGSAVIWAVLKGNGYGLGLLPMAETCRAAGLDHFAVTEIAEARALREGGFETEPILMLQPTADADEITALLPLHVIFTISSTEDASVLAGLAAQAGVTAEAHIKIDTGMGRYGFLPEEMEKITPVYHYMDTIHVTGIYTHLHSAFCDKKATKAQIESFNRVLAALREAFPLFDKKLRGYAMPDAVLTGVETRSSSPVRIVRGETGQSNLRGVYPCGEGAGYAGGILSAAVDGIRQAENWLSQHME